MKLSGGVGSAFVSSKAEREQLETALDYVRDGDTLVITKLDRLARSVFHLVTIGKRLEEKGVALSSRKASRKSWQKRKVRIAL